MSMNYGRVYVAMTAIGDTIYATGGYSDASEVYPTIVESFTRTHGWVVEEEMELTVYRPAHCSVAIGSQLFIIGGYVGSPASSNSVQSFDTSNKNGGWTDRQPLKTDRYGHACQVAKFENQEGIFVSGGRQTVIAQDFHVLSSVEFYVPSTGQWRSLGSLQGAREYHSMGFVGMEMVVAGGYPGPKTSIETLNGTAWNKRGDLEAKRGGQATIIFPSSLLQC